MDSRLKEKLLSLPTTSGVYLMKDYQNNIIYVGKAKNLKRRVNSYFINNKKNEKTHNLVSNINDFDYILTNSELDALMLENNLIKKHQPYYNILLKDGKSFPYIKISTKDDFPRLEVTRKIRKDNAKYYGPYFAGIDVHKLIELINSAFLVRKCNKIILEDSKPVRPCLNYSMGLCSAPCAKYINKEDYSKIIQDIHKFLQGDVENVRQILNNKMEKASDNLNFERALELREQIKYLDRLKVRLTTQLPKMYDGDFFGYYSDGINSAISVLIVRDGKVLGCENYNIIAIDEKQDVLSSFISQYYSLNRTLPKEIIVDCEITDKESLLEFLKEKKKGSVDLIVAQKGLKHQLMITSINNAKEFLEKSLTKQENKEKRTIKACERLQKVLNLPSIPYRMECYDISHISGTNKVASMVVFINGEPAKAHYRKFIIKTVEGNNDFASLMETLQRRLVELKTSQDISFSSKPNLIVIDGGKGQLSSVMEIVENMGINDINFISLAKREEEVFTPHNSEPVVLRKSDVALQLLQRIRDEAHRFAITFHRSKRGKSMTESELTEIDGLGKVKSKLLLERFGSIDGIKQASLEELNLVRGIDMGLATRIKQHFENKKTD